MIKIIQKSKNGKGTYNKGKQIESNQLAVYN